MSANNSYSVRLWVLGAADPEMQAIETLLTQAGEQIAYTVGADGNRVHPGNAYKATGFRLANGNFATRWQGPLVLVECDGDISNEEWQDTTSEAPEGQAVSSGAFLRVDHHRPGDPGYGRGAEEFLSASSIGQVISHLAKLGRLPRWDAAGENMDCPTGAFSRGHIRGQWFVFDGDLGADVPREVVLAAAADHCLESAYRGRCPGVNPDELMRWRVESRAAFQGRSAEEVLADVERAREMLRFSWHATCQVCQGVHHYDECTSHYPVGEYADLRGRHVPELPEAAAREGIPFLSTVRDRDGREKVVLMAAPPDLVWRFLDGEIVPDLTGLYGDPARGFAGGYLS